MPKAKLNDAHQVVLCNARDRCGIADCPHAEPHVWYDIGAKSCVNDVSCVRWAMTARGVGEKRAMCRCEEVERCQR